MEDVSTPGEIRLIVSCRRAARERGGIEHVDCELHQQENRQFFEPGTGSGQLTMRISNPEGQQVWDPDSDYEVIARPLPKDEAK